MSRISKFLRRMTHPARGVNDSPAAQIGVEAREIVIDAYRVLLEREVDADGLDHHSRELASGRLDVAGFLDMLLHSPERTSRPWRMDDATAQQVVTEIYRIFLKRNPSNEDLREASYQLTSGMLNIVEFIRSVHCSDESKSLSSVTTQRELKLPYASSGTMKVVELCTGLKGIGRPSADDLPDHLEQEVFKDRVLIARLTDFVR